MDLAKMQEKQRFEESSDYAFEASLINPEYHNLSQSNNRESVLGSVTEADGISPTFKSYRQDQGTQHIISFQNNSSNRNEQLKLSVKQMQSERQDPNSISPFVHHRGVTGPGGKHPVSG